MRKKLHEDVKNIFILTTHASVSLYISPSSDGLGPVRVSAGGPLQLWPGGSVCGQDEAAALHVLMRDEAPSVERTLEVLEDKEPQDWEEGSIRRPARK